MTRAIISLLFVLGCYGCSAGSDQPLRSNIIDRDGYVAFENTDKVSLLPGAFNQDQKDLIYQAAQNWHDATNGFLNMTFVEGEDFPFIYNGTLPPNILGMELGDKYHKPVIVLDVQDFMVPDDHGVEHWLANTFLEVVMHEMGHGYGLDHLNGPGILMNYTPVGITCIDWATIEYLCSSRDCPWGYHSTCN